ncbi:cutinase-domain-containing protein [Xylariaceae sp. AK1471]|nr:cutinase-domain-containing protein [Xylariaceae sp. AK1471]
MKSLILPLLLLLCLGNPVTSAPSHLHARQNWTVGWWSSELLQYGCRPIIFVFAKATFEPGNVVCLPPSRPPRFNGGTIGPTLSDGLKMVFGVTNVATQGVDYYGFLEGNYYPGGAPPWGIYDMQAILTSAAACPHSKIIVSGYSQGAAIVHRAIEGLTPEVKARIAGVVTFGDTQTLQDGGRIQGFPANQTLIICNVGDVICVGTLLPLFPVHWDYVKWVPTATLFLAQMVLSANAVDPWPNANDTFVSMNMTGVEELGEGADPNAPLPTKVVAFPEPEGTSLA